MKREKAHLDGGCGRLRVAGEESLRGGRRRRGRRRPSARSPFRRTRERSTHRVRKQSSSAHDSSHARLGPKLLAVLAREDVAVRNDGHGALCAARRERDALGAYWVPLGRLVPCAAVHREDVGAAGERLGDELVRPSARRSRSSSARERVRGAKERVRDARRVVVDADLDADGEVPPEALLGRPDEVAHEIGLAQQGAADALVVRPFLRAACETCISC